MSLQNMWNEKYVMLAAGMPIYWGTVMFGHFAKAFYGVPAAKSYDEVVREPRKYFDAFAAGDSENAGKARRGAAAHQNGWEAFILYLSAVVAAHGAKVDPKVFNNHCALAIVLRMLFNVLYISDIGVPRSLTFFAHVFTCFSLHYKAYLAITA
eukprot:TRINITY_DN3110_c0_g1_i1.p3 TRINITY_DN3110_c0_g1~~TRINITY_DN3110_c0_g1_i1.p3  ORF type:complete len:153 (+),score=62.28 TRINITY_DN3110_c0_g1_i1:67-525(+)